VGEFLNRPRYRRLSCSSSDKEMLKQIVAVNAVVAVVVAVAMTKMRSRSRNFLA